VLDGFTLLLNLN